MELVALDHDFDVSRWFEDGVESSGDHERTATHNEMRFDSGVATDAPRQRCVPRNYCVHNRYRWRCRDCGVGYCVHGKRQYQCTLCRNTNTHRAMRTLTMRCVHNVLRYDCSLCNRAYGGKPARNASMVGNKARCVHGRSKYRCRACGTGYCEHSFDKYRCPHCGTGHCSHGINKLQCARCKPAPRPHIGAKSHSETSPPTSGEHNTLDDTLSG